MAGQIGSAVMGEIVDRAFSKAIQRFNRQAAADEKLRRLEMLLINIHSTVEASQKHSITNTWLLQWQERLKEAASQGKDVLLSFKQRAMDVKATQNTHVELGSSTSGALSFTRHALSGMVQCIRNATKTLYSSDEDVEKLNTTVERLEKLSADTGEFIQLLQLEALPTVEQRRTRRTSRAGPDSSAIAKVVKGTRKRKKPLDSLMDSSKMLFSWLRSIGTLW